MATVDFPDELFATLMFGDNEDLECFLAHELAGFRDRLPNSHQSTESTSSSSLFPYLFLMGNEDDAMLMAEEVGAADFPKPPPLNTEYIEKLEDARVEESGSVCSICLDEMLIGSRAKRLPCSHVYHGNCIGEWLKKTNSCPVCRHQIRPSS